MIFKQNRLLKLLLLLVIIVLGLAFIDNTISKPKVTLNIKKSDNNIIFSLASKRVDGFLNLKVISKAENKQLWDVNLNYFPGGNIQYGVAPNDFVIFNGQKQTAHQVFPPNLKPDSLQNSSEIDVILTYQYNQTDPLTGKKCYKFNLKNIMSKKIKAQAIDCDYLIATEHHS